MNVLVRKFPWLAAALVMAGAQQVFPAEATNSPVTPPLPPLKSPVEAFRALLLMPTAEQLKLLAIRPPDIRDRLLAKIQEYRLLTPEERELRLQATELRWYLTPLLSLPAANRAEHLARIPRPTRDLVEARLQHWALLPPPLREVLLTNREAMTYWTHIDAATNAPSSPSEALRNRMQKTVERFFELTQKEKEKTLGSFSEAERQQMEKTLFAFERLTPPQRRRCVLSFTKFATLNPEERQEFLKNAERWSQMSPTEREAWRELVNRAPILPPWPYPPLPSLVPATSSPPASSNGR